MKAFDHDLIIIAVLDVCSIVKSGARPCDKANTTLYLKVLRRAELVLIVRDDDYCITERLLEGIKFEDGRRPFGLKYPLDR